MPVLGSGPQSHFFCFSGSKSLSDIINRVEALMTPLLAPANIELVDLTYQKGPAGWTLSVYLDKPGGITLDDCSEWSRRIGEILDQSEAITHAYALEVSSPGLDRPLKKLADFKKYQGERVSVKLFAPLNGQKNFHGLLQDANEETVALEVEGHQSVSLPMKQIARAKLDPIIEI
jgi:ribosome maturation factor RimP